jgi:hypothetical protein
MADQRENVHGKARGKPGDVHHDRWSEAMNAALAAIPTGGGKYEATFHVDVSANPGHINEYLVVLRPSS